MLVNENIFIFHDRVAESSRALEASRLLGTEIHCGSGGSSGSRFSCYAQNCECSGKCNVLNRNLQSTPSPSLSALYRSSSPTAYPTVNPVVDQLTYSPTLHPLTQSPSTTDQPTVTALNTSTPLNTTEIIPTTMPTAFPTISTTESTTTTSTTSGTV